MDNSERKRLLQELERMQTDLFNAIAEACTEFGRCNKFPYQTMNVKNRLIILYLN